LCYVEVGCAVRVLDEYGVISIVSTLKMVAAACSFKRSTASAPVHVVKNRINFNIAPT
jgi:hypothetical protein